MRVLLDPTSLDDYGMFLKIKSLPTYRFEGRTAVFPDEYAGNLGLKKRTGRRASYRPSEFLFDYQADIARIAIAKQKYCTFADCGLGKTLIFAEFIRHALAVMPADKRALIVSPLMVVSQTMDELCRFYGDGLVPEQRRAADLQAWLHGDGGRFAITNYEAMREDLDRGRLGCLVLDESSMLKSHYGKWGTAAIQLGRGVEWKMACTGTPAPNDRIEYANHAVFMDAFPTVNSFLAKFFINRGQTNERWEIKAHALEAFYRALSHWCIFLSDPSVYGWKDNTADIPPIIVHIDPIPSTLAQIEAVMDSSGMLFAMPQGIGSRSTLSQIAKGRYGGQKIETHKPPFIRRLVDSFGGESTIIWCLYNHEQDLMEQTFPEAASIRGETPYEQREIAIRAFKAGTRKILISKPKVLGFGLNLQVATRQVFSGLQDSYESYYQAVKRSNRYGSIKPLNVHIPVTELERPMVDNVLRKARMIEADTRQQESMFARFGVNYAT